MGDKVASRQKIYSFRKRVRRDRKNAQWLARAIAETKLPRQNGREIKRVAETEHHLAVEIPLVVRVDPIGVEPRLAIVIPVDVEHVRVAVGVRDMYKAPPKPLVPECSKACIASGISNALAPCTKYLLFFKLAHATLSLTAVKETPGMCLLDSAAGSPCRLHTRLIPISVYKKAPRYKRGAKS